MQRRGRIAILVILALSLGWLAFRESNHFIAELNHLSIPNHETREPLGRRAHAWMSAEELARFYGVTIETVFQALNIDPVPGDEDLPLKDLARKYEKSPDEVERALEILNDPPPSPESPNHG